MRVGSVETEEGDLQGAGTGGALAKGRGGREECGTSEQQVTAQKLQGDLSHGGSPKTGPSGHKSRNIAGRSADGEAWHRPIPLSCAPRLGTPKARKCSSRAAWRLRGISRRTLRKFTHGPGVKASSFLSAIKPQSTDRIKHMKCFRRKAHVKASARRHFNSAW